MTSLRRARGGLPRCALIAQSCACVCVATLLQLEVVDNSEPNFQNIHRAVDVKTGRLMAEPGAWNAAPPHEGMQEVVQAVSAHHTPVSPTDCARNLASNEYVYNCNGQCGSRSRCFLGKCYCLPGWGGPKCLQRKVYSAVVDADLCPVIHTLQDLRLVRATEYPEYTTRCRLPHHARHPINCALACYWQADAGIMQVSESLWALASDFEFGVWKRAEMYAPSDRDDEHAEGFGAFRAVPQELGDLLEIGAGPYTQTKSLLQHRPDVRVRSISLAEPNIFRYLSLSNCAYKDGSLLGHRVNLMSLPVEELPANEHFDTVVQVNVIEHVNNGFDFLIAAYRALRPNGTLIFHERYFNDAVTGKDTAVLGSLMLHPIRVTRDVLIHFFRLFEPIYVDTLRTAASIARGLGEHGYYFVGRKRSVPLPENEPVLSEFSAKFAV